eukprot:COSAG06_NODE_455_length_15521_cov_8.312022_1_plen_155_part_00
MLALALPGMTASPLLVVLLLLLLLPPPPGVGAELDAKARRDGSCQVSLQKQTSITNCTGGPWGRFGCFGNDTKYMWAGEGCRGIFRCNGNSSVPCGDGFHRKLACPCVAGPGLPPPPPFPPPPPPPPIPPAPPAPPGPLCNINGTWNMTVRTCM